MEDFGNFQNLVLEDSERVRIGQHEAGDFRVNGARQLVQVDAAPVVGFEFLNLVARNDNARGIGAVSRIGNQYLLPHITPLGETGADHQDSGQLPLRPGGQVEEKSGPFP